MCVYVHQFEMAWKFDVGQGTLLTLFFCVYSKIALLLPFKKKKSVKVCFPFAFM